MYLKCIEVQGFKSFAQKIVFDFHNGITGIVGPNGSGKSNVADAVRWVLGEQSAKQLRGGNMQDVIFAGTQTRKPLSYASVAITLDNSDHQLAVEYEEVTVTRRLYRSGESEYLINGSICRLRDINEMFYDTGIGKEGYSIIGQGQIDKILSGKPEERRELFDEAAGIVKFKRRKNAAIKKLEDEKQNLVRVTDILTELTRQLKPLEKQAESARIYLNRREEQKRLDVQIFLAESEKTEADLRDLEDKLETAGSQLAETTEAYEATRQEYEKLNQELESLLRELDLKKQDAQNDELKKEQLEGQIRVLQEQLQAAKGQEELLGSRLSAIAEEMTGQEEQRDQLRAEKAVLEKEALETASVLREKEEELLTVREHIQDCEQAVQEGKNEIIELMERRATTKGKAERYDTLMEQIELRKAKVAQRVLSLKSEEETLGGKQSKARREYEAVSASIQDLSFRNESIRSSIDELTKELGTQNDQLQIGQTAYHRENSRLEALRNMAERYDGFGNSIRRVMEQKEKQPGLYGVVADLIHTEKGYELAIETALGGTIQNIVTDHEQTAKKMIEYLKKNRYGRATFLPLDSLVSRGDFSPREALKEKGVIGLASSLVKTEDRFQKLASYLLGRTLVVDDIDHAIALAGKYRHSLRIVTLEGESLSPGGSMTGGAFRNSSNLLGRRREIEELEKSVSMLKKELDELQAAVSANRDKRNGLRDELNRIREQQQEAYVEQNTIQMKLNNLKQEAVRLQEEERSIEGDQADIRKDTQDLKQENQSVQEELDLSSRDEKELNTYIETRQEELAGLRTEEGELSAELEAIRMNAAASEQKLSFTMENLEKLDTARQSLKTERKDLEQALTGSRNDQAEKEEQIDAIRQASEGLGTSIQESRNSIEELSALREEKNARHKTFFDKRDELSQQMNQLDRECFRLKTQKEKQEENQESRVSYLWEEYQITPSAARDLKEETQVPVRELKKELSQVREEIRALGPVNVHAIEEFRELSERHGFLSGQYEDLKKAEETLEGIIAELDDGMRRQFQEKFQEIQREFNHTFQELFGGGKGSIILDEEEEDILEAGIHIISQPPGKKLQNMMQLSGGEKALTAIALLFAIQNLKPSPFCLLDEIEAALDDSNVGRFAAYLQKLTRQTQFIVITHRRGTMNAADRLYGITMQEKGVSTLVSVDLVEKQLTG